MRIIQKIIKCFAIVFAIGLIIGIATGIFSLADGIAFFTKNNKEEITNVTEQKLNVDNSNLSMDIPYSNLKIVTGEEYKIETNNKYLKITEDNNTTHIKDTRKLFKTKNYNITIYIPEDKEFSNVNLSSGAGKIEISKLKVSNLSFDLGAGLVVMDEITVTNSADIDTGAGSFTIKSGSINNLDLDVGVGEVKIGSVLLGNNKIDNGVGKLNINLLDSIENYTLDINKGIGEIRINGEEVIDNYDKGSGENKIYIDGGIGRITITTVN